MLARVYESTIQPSMSYSAAISDGDLKVRQTRTLLSSQRVLAVKVVMSYNTVSTETNIERGITNRSIQDEGMKKAVFTNQREKALREELGTRTYSRLS